MGFSNIFIIGGDYKDLNPQLSSQHLFAEVVLLDGTNPGVLYQLKSETLGDENDIIALKQGILTLQTDEPFIIMGDVVSIDRSKKQVILANSNVISYKYLIVSTGTRGGNEFSNSLQTLFYALLLAKKMPEAVNLAQKNQILDDSGKILQNSTFTHTLSPDIIEKLVQKKLSENDLQSQTNLIDTIRKFCQVQV